MSSIFIIAEAGVNHNGNLEIAKKMIDIAADSGVDAVKFQAYCTDDLVTSALEKAEYQSENMKDSEITQHEMLKRYELSGSDLVELKECAKGAGLEFLATPFDLKSVDTLEPLVSRYKVSSGDCTNIPLLEYIAEKGKPIILSTGMATMKEIEEAVTALKKKVANITLLHCTTDYPAKYEEVNLNAINTMKDKFLIPIGYSDHTIGIEVSVAAVAMGATVIEKHFTLDKNMEGPDHKASAEPHELKEMVSAIRNIEVALGNGAKGPQASEIKTKKIARKSLFFACDLQMGELLTSDDISIKRPGTGMPPAELKKVIGRKLKRAVRMDEPVSLQVLEG